MAFIEIQTNIGPQKVRVCDNCRCVCIPSGRFCSGVCARKYRERAEIARKSADKNLKPMKE